MHAEISVDQQRNIRLLYNPRMLRDITMKQLDSLLHHEGCHAVAVPSTIRPSLDGRTPRPILADYFDCYAEYLAHIEFLRRYRATEIHNELRSLQLSLLGNIETIIQSLRQKADPNQRIPATKDQFEMLEVVLLSIVYDSMFFLVAADDAFLTRCRNLNVVGLHRFAEWVYEDFEYIRRLGMPFQTTMDAVVFSGELSTCIDPRCLMLRGEILFHDRILQTMQRGRSANQKWTIDLAAVWEKRLSY